MNYSLHYEFSDQITKADKHGWQTRRRNPDEEFTLTRETFYLEQPKAIMNITNGAILEKDDAVFLMN